MAAITVEQPVMPSRSEYPGNLQRVSARDPLGDRVRRKLYLAWRAIHDLSAIARQVRRGELPLIPLARSRTRNNSAQPLRPSVEQFDTWCDLRPQRTSNAWARAVRQEMAVAQHWAEHISRLGLEAMEGLNHLVQSVIPGILNMSATNPYGDHDQWKSPIQRSSFSMVQFALWTLIEAGPFIFWRAWLEMASMHAHLTYLSDWIHVQWNGFDRTLAVIRCELSRLLWYDLYYGRIRSRMLDALRQHFTTQQDMQSISKMVAGYTIAISPIRAHRDEETKRDGQLRYEPAYQHVPFKQFLRLDETLGLQSLARPNVIVCNNPDPGRPHHVIPAQEQMSRMNADYAFEDSVLEAIRDGKLVLPA